MSNQSDEGYGSAIATVNNATNDGENCVHQPLLLLEFKMFFVGCLGVFVAAVSLVNNLILLSAFLTSRKNALNSRRNMTYLTGLSVCDVLISFFYIVIMGVQVYAEYLPSVALFAAWHAYLPLAFTLSHITFTAASFLLVAASLERYLFTIRGAKSTVHFVAANRRQAALLAVAIAVLMKGTIIFEIQIYHDESCEGLAGRGVTLSDLALNPVYDSVWRFWTRRIVTIFLPFFLLAYSNFATVYGIKRAEQRKYRTPNVVAVLFDKGLDFFTFSIRQKSILSFEKLARNCEAATDAQQHLQQQQEEEQQVFVDGGSDAHQRRGRRGRRASSPRVRSATRMLIIVVSCYLVANALDVLLAIWEYFDANSLAEMSNFYTVATDVSSLLSVLSSALRLPIYCIAGDKLLKAEIHRTTTGLWCWLCCAAKAPSLGSRLHQSVILPLILVFIKQGQLDAYILRSDADAEKKYSDVITAN